MASIPMRSLSGLQDKEFLAERKREGGTERGGCIPGERLQYVGRSGINALLQWRYLAMLVGQGSIERW